MEPYELGQINKGIIILKTDRYSCDENVNFFVPTPTMTRFYVNFQIEVINLSGQSDEFQMFYFQNYTLKSSKFVFA